MEYLREGEQPEYGRMEMQRVRSVDLGELIRGKRKGMKMTQSQLAEASGIAISRITMLEMGAFRNLPQPWEIKGLCKALDLSEKTILDVSGYNQEPEIPF